MHSLNGNNIPYALNDDDHELDENDSDDVFDDDNDGIDDCRRSKSISRLEG